MSFGLANCINGEIKKNYLHNEEKYFLETRKTKNQMESNTTVIMRCQRIVTRASNLVIRVT